MMLKPALRPPMRAPMRSANSPREGVGVPTGFGRIFLNGSLLLLNGYRVLLKVQS